MSSPEAAATATARVTRVRMLRAVQAIFTLAAFTYLYSIVDRDALLRAFSGLSFATFAFACGLGYVALAFGVLRWRLLLAAFGAERPPPMLTLAKFYIVGMFYNTYLPGAVAGDVVRGVASRAAFGARGVTSALAVVVVERVFGLSAMLLLTAGVSVVHPLRGAPAAWIVGLMGVGASTAAILGLVMARRLAFIFPPKLARLLESLPAPVRLSPFLLAIPAALACQLAPALAGFVLIESLVPNASLLDALVIVPLALAAAFAPITIGGAGVREAAFVELYALVGVPRPLALAASLALWGLQLVVAATGGVCALISPITETPIVSTEAERLRPHPHTRA